MAPRRKKPGAGEKFGIPFFARRRAKNFPTHFSFSSDLIFIFARYPPWKNLAMMYAHATHVYLFSQPSTEPNFSLVPYRLVVDDDVSVIGEGVDNWSGLFWRIATIASSGFNWVSWNSWVPLRVFCLNMALNLLHVWILFSENRQDNTGLFKYSLHYRVCARRVRISTT